MTVLANHFQPFGHEKRVVNVPWDEALLQLDSESLVDIERIGYGHKRIQLGLGAKMSTVQRDGVGPSAHAHREERPTIAAATQQVTYTLHDRHHVHGRAVAEAWCCERRATIAPEVHDAN
jgi:hypothetical protein